MQFTSGGKIIKKIIKISTAAVVAIVLIPIVMSVVLLIPPVQTRIAQSIASRLSEKYNAEISVGRVWFIPLSRLIINDVIIKDQQHDTLASIDQLTASIDLFAISNKKIKIHYLIADSPKVHIKEMAGKFNFSFLIDSSPKDTTEWMWQIETTSVEMKNGICNIDLMDTSKTVVTGFNPSHLRISNLNFVAKQIFLNADTFGINLQKLAFDEQSGFSIKKSRLKLSGGKQGLHTNNVRVETGESIIRIDSCSIHYPDNQDSSRWTTQTEFNIQLLPSLISPNDFALFANVNKLSINPLTVSGQFSGTIANLKGKNVELSYGEQTFFKTNFDVMGLPEIDETFVFIDINELQTHTSEINSILNAFPDIKDQQLPLMASRLGKIKYKGNFTGYLNDIVAYGMFQTNLGMIQTDLGVKYTDRMNYSGSLRTIGFNVGEMLDMTDQMGKITMKMTVNGSHQSNDNYFAYLQGNIDSVSVRNYTYHNIELNGLFANHKFDGQVEMSDPNGQLSFSGNVDFSKENSNFNFYARLRNICPDKLNIVPELKDTKISLDLISNFEAGNLDDMVGFIRLNNGLIQNPKQTLRIDSIVVNASRSGDQKRLTINSDLLNAHISGKYNFIYIQNELHNLISYYLPAIQSKKGNTTSYDHNNFTFSLNLKKLGRALTFFDPNIELSETGSIQGSLNSSKHQINIETDIPRFKYRNAEGTDLHVSVNSNGQLNTSIGLSNLRLFDLMNLNNFSTTHSANKNQLISNITWNNRKDVLNEGVIQSTSTFSRADTNMVIAINLQPSRIVVNDSLWNIRPSTITLSSGNYTIDNFRIWHANQQFVADGSIKKDGNDGLSGYIRDINLDEVLKNLDMDNVAIAGNLNGEFKASNLLVAPSIIGEININDLSFNNSLMGDLTISSSWGEKDNSLIIDTRLMKDGNEKLSGGGYYSINNNTIAYEGIANQLDIDFVSYYVEGVMNNFKGQASGIVNLNGSISEPVLTAKVNVDNGKFDVDFLKTSYTIQDSAFLEPNRIVFRNMTLRDKHKHKGTFNGDIKHNHFSNLQFNLNINTNNMLVLDTKEKDNPSYYGTIYSTALMQLTGSADLVNIGVNGRTMPNTYFYIPIKDNAEVSSNSFIRFASPKDEKSTTAQEVQTQKSGLEMVLNLDVTPDAKTQIIFDARSGDILKGIGTGEIQLKIDRYQNLSIYGDYVFEEGDYLFSLQNLINKKFIINKGSRLRWDGDPYNAIINLDAAYKLRANLYDLVGATLNDPTSSSELKKRVPITCNLSLSDRLKKPNIKLGIETPSLDQAGQNFIKEYIPSEEEMNRQVLSLLVINRFYSPEQQNTADQGQSRGVNNTALVTTTEMLSNQLNHWLSQITSDVDVGISYRPGDEITSREMEVALSTQFFNDRLTLNGNFGYSEYPTETKTNNLIGDFDMNLKLNPSGTLRAHAYTKTNNDILNSTTSPTKQGVGLTFRQEFDNWVALMKKYLAILNGDERKKKQTEVEEE